MASFLVAVVILGILGVAVWYIRKEKKRGVRCVGCPDGGTCSGHCSGCHSGMDT